MTESTTTSLRRLLSRSSSSVKCQQHPNDPVLHRPGLVEPHNSRNGSWSSDQSHLVSPDFLAGCGLLRVTRKKARTKIFTINESSGAVAIDGATKFSVDNIRDIRSGEDATHYRELCKISAEHESRWLSIVYYLEGTKLKVLHVVCPSNDKLKQFRQSLLRLHHHRARMNGAAGSLFGHDHTTIDEDMWCTLLPVNKAHNTDTSVPHSQVNETPPNRRMQSRLSFAEVRSLCSRLHFNAPEPYLAKVFQKVDKEHTGTVDFPLFKQFVDILKTRQDIVAIYEQHKDPDNMEMTRPEFKRFLQEVQGLDDPEETLDKIFDRAREPISVDKQDCISATNFTAYILSKHNSLLSNVTSDMTRPLNEYFISSSHNTYLTGRQVGDESSIEPYIRVLQKGCRCIEIDIWPNSEGQPEVRHGRAFTTSISLESVLKVIDKYAFIVTPWPLIISLEIRCSSKTQAIVADLLIRVFGEVLLLSRLTTGETRLPSPMALRHRILLKIKSTDHTSSQLRDLEHRFANEKLPQDGPVSIDVHVPFSAEDSSVSTSAPDSDNEFPRRISRTSSVSSRSSSYSSSASPIYRTLAAKPSTIIEDLQVMAPYLKGVKFRNFSLPESKVFNHVFSLSERTIKQFSHETTMQVRKHNTRYMMRVYPSQARLMSSNFLPHHYWQQGVQMVAMNCQTHDAGLRMNEAFFAIDDHSADTIGYLAKPAHLLQWEKGQETSRRAWPRRQWSITIISGVQLPKGQGTLGKISPCVELEVYRPQPSLGTHLPASSTTNIRSPDRNRESRFKTKVVEDNGFNPYFDTTLDFLMYEDEDPHFTFLHLLLKDAISNDVLGQCVVPLHRLQRGYRSVGLYDAHGERFIFSSLFVKISHAPAASVVKTCT
ncbi:1-phosphatidylinositol-4,5-bisphosphate phosphodiesterase 1 [Taphrina deformans PYCC 5710]|uniref:Phosphoinositide phospholipase C n=1 Tax=Taphrina deformans (strain PYCC 5710 / ATCC 11124 / CBS 356.35 / IMI 108563 / JCM 9778 / NBRC 8474) TaxID=1097556 RepID=R4XC63_TAPDE|nr:1-phosphatidylinositol-4,5-bisphosphate phosphodiesterase 1 [Taphrina deformans PYCC 5710]|eukprot:CCG80925.1 1-phosphatidylinositol-4,5-bisphosphate phosphodiesterase 1 [Taphrina deformans PYCC 5710]